MTNFINEDERRAYVQTLVDKNATLKAELTQRQITRNNMIIVLDYFEESILRNERHIEEAYSSAFFNPNEGMLL